MLVTIMSDASVDNDLKVGGFGYWIASLRGKQGGGGAFKTPTHDSYNGELKAAVNALQAALRATLVQKGDTVLFQLDNAAVVKILGDIEEGARLTNRQDMKEVIAHLADLVTDFDLKLKSKHVKGHSNPSLGARFASNVHCDRRAYEGMLKARKNALSKIKAEAKKKHPTTLAKYKGKNLKKKEAA